MPRASNPRARSLLAMNDDLAKANAKLKSLMGDSTLPAVMERGKVATRIREIEREIREFSYRAKSVMNLRGTNVIRH